MEQEQLQRILEAALLASPQPLTVNQMGDLFGEDERISADDIRRALLALAEASAPRGIELLEVASGFRYQVRTEVYAWVSRLWQEKPPRYSRALLETLALIAYRQPITRGEIEQIRGVAVNTQIIRTLEDREWIRIIGHRDVPGKPALFGTTRGFLDYFNLKSLDQLPPLASLQDLPELEPQLLFDTPPPALAALAGTPLEHVDDLDVLTHDSSSSRGADPANIFDPADDVSSSAVGSAEPQDTDCSNSISQISPIGELDSGAMPEQNV